RARGARGGALPANLLEIDRARLAALDVIDPIELAHGEEAQDGLVEAQRALELGHRLARVEIEQGQVVALLEALDLERELLLAHVVDLERRRAAALEDAPELRDEGLAAFLGNLGLDDESGIELPHGVLLTDGPVGWLRAPGLASVP